MRFLGNTIGALNRLSRRSCGTIRRPRALHTPPRQPGAGRAGAAQRAPARLKPRPPPGASTGSGCSRAGAGGSAWAARRAAARSSPGWARSPPGAHSRSAPPTPGPSGRQQLPTARCVFVGACSALYAAHLPRAVQAPQGHRQRRHGAAASQRSLGSPAERRPSALGGRAAPAAMGRHLLDAGEHRRLRQHALAALRVVHLHHLDAMPCQGPSACAAARTGVGAACHVTVRLTPRGTV